MEWLRIEIIEWSEDATLCEQEDENRTCSSLTGGSQICTRRSQTVPSFVHADSLRRLIHLPKRRPTRLRPSKLISNSV
jgi:hypothetical protein